jgi:hypothetical protein
MPVLNHDFVRALKPQAKPFEVRDAKLKGFLLRVQPSGVMTYYVEYRRGKRKRIGPADALAPSNAREAARLVLAEAALGGDPIAAAQEAKAHTFRSFVDEVYEPWVKANTRAPKATLGRLRANFPDLQHKKLARSTPGWSRNGARPASRPAQSPSPSIATSTTCARCSPRPLPGGCLKHIHWSA